MDACHILLGRPWKFDRGVMHDGRKNTYQFEKYGKKFNLHPFNENKYKDGKALLNMVLAYVKEVV